MTGWFEQQPHSCFLYVNNVCVKGYYDAPELLRTFSDAFHRMSIATFRLLSLTSTSIPDNPDVVDDYFELCSTVLLRQPSLLLETELVLTAFQCACAGLQIQHREAHRAVVGFIEHLLHIHHGGVRGPITAATYTALEALLMANGSQLMQALIVAVAGMVPPTRVRFLSPLLRGLVTMDARTTREWAENAVKSLPPDGHMDGATLIQAMYSPEALVREDRGMSEKAFDNAVEAFSSACRRRRLL
jgi:transportin-3